VERWFYKRWHIIGYSHPSISRCNVLVVCHELVGPLVLHAASRFRVFYAEPRNPAQSCAGHSRHDERLSAGESARKADRCEEGAVTSAPGPRLSHQSCVRCAEIGKWNNVHAVLYDSVAFGAMPLDLPSCTGEMLVQVARIIETALTSSPKRKQPACVGARYTLSVCFGLVTVHFVLAFARLLARAFHQQLLPKCGHPKTRQKFSGSQGSDLGTVTIGTLQQVETSP